MSEDIQEAPYESAYACLSRIIPPPEGRAKSVNLQCQQGMTQNPDAVTYLDRVAQDAIALRVVEAYIASHDPAWLYLYGHFGDLNQKKLAVTYLAKRIMPALETEIDKGFVEDIVKKWADVSGYATIEQWTTKLEKSQPTLYRWQKKVRRHLLEGFCRAVDEAETILHQRNFIK